MTSIYKGTVYYHKISVELVVVIAHG